MTTKETPVTGEVTGNGRGLGANVSGAYNPYSTTASPQMQARVLATPLYVPSDLEAIDHWVCWRYAEVNGRLTKVPVNPRTGGKARTNTPSTWGKLDAALDYYHTHPETVSGIGFCQRGTDIIGVDLDHCIHDGALSPDAARIVREINSYTEVSPSGTGLRIFAHGTKPGKRERAGTIDGAELYDGTSTRFLTFTGRHFPGTPLEVLDAQSAVDALYRELWPAKSTPAPAPAPAHPLDLDDSDLLARALTAKNGATFGALWRGDTSGHSSPSEADFALCGALLFWTGGDVDRVDQLFRQSGLMRGKWDRKTGASTYGALTIANCAAGKTRYYTPQSPRAVGVAAGGEIAQPPSVGDLWRLLNEHVTLDGERCSMCGRWTTWEQTYTDHKSGGVYCFRCHKSDCLDWQTHRAKELVVQSDMHLWPAWWLTKVPLLEYDKLIDRGLLSRQDNWRGVLETNELVFVASSFPIDARSTETRLDALAPMLALCWLSRKPGSRLRDPKKLARSKRAAVACDAVQPAAVVAVVAEPAKVTRRAAFGLIDLATTDVYTLLDVIESAGGDVDRKRRRWSYALDLEHTIRERVTQWAAVAGLGGRYEITASRTSPQIAAISDEPATVEVIAGDLHPDIAKLQRVAVAGLATNHCLG